MNSHVTFKDPQIPWCIDLDGTLVKEDVTVLAFKELLTSAQIGKLLWALLLFVRGYAQAKHFVESIVKVDVSALTYNEELVHLINDHRSRGGKAFLATAADEGVATRVAKHLRIFDGVLASNGQVNRRARAKAEALNQMFGSEQYLYAGNSRDDLQVWPDAGAVMVVNAPASVRDRACALGKPNLVIAGF